VFSVSDDDFGLGDVTWAKLGPVFENDAEVLDWCIVCAEGWLGWRRVGSNAYLAFVNRLHASAATVDLADDVAAMDATDKRCQNE
jgi:hypothetical protein